HGFVGQLVAIEPPLLEELRRELRSDVTVERLRFRRMVREERVRLDVEGEVRWGSLDPELGVPLGRREVVRGVDLDQWELRGVELQSTLGGLGPRWVEVAVLDQRGIRPRGGPDQDRTPCHEVEPSPPVFSSGFFRRIASFAWFAFSLAIFSNRWAQTYSVARIASPAMITT